jgi:hypothetical protein
MSIPTGAEVFRDYELDGVPASGPNQPDKREIRALTSFYETMIGTGVPGLAYPTLAALVADVSHAANSTAIVYNDVAANNGLYRLSGSWSRIGDLPNVIVRLTVTGGTANAIVATAPEAPLVPGNKLYLMTPTAANTAAVTINGVPLKDAFGNDPANGALQNNSQVLMAWAVDHYQLLISANVDASGILSSALAAATASAGSATAAASSASALGNQAYTFDTQTQAAAATIPTGLANIRIIRASSGSELINKIYVPGTSTDVGAFVEAGGHYWKPDPTQTPKGVLPYTNGQVPAAIPSAATVTMATGTPGIVTHTAYNKPLGTPVFYATTGALFTGLTAGTTYFIVPLTLNTYALATSLANALAGTKITFSGTQSGTHTANYDSTILYPNKGYIIRSIIPIAGPGFGMTTGSGGQIWNSLTVPPGIWLVGGQGGVIHDASSASTAYTHMHNDHGLGTSSIQTAPGDGTTTALHISSNNANGWIFPLGTKPYVLPSGGTINAVMTVDFTGGGCVAYGSLWALLM